MPAGTLHTWIKRHITVRRRLERICTGYMLFLMVATTKHSLTEAARFSGLPPSLFSKLLHAHAQVAITTLDQLSKRQARQFAKALPRVHGHVVRGPLFLAGRSCTTHRTGQYTRVREPAASRSLH